MLLVDIIAFLLLALLCYQDFKEKQVYWFIFPLLAATFAIKGYMQLDVNIYLNYILLNMAFMVLNLALLTLYFSIKEKKILLITRRHIGWGDILFFAAVCFAMTTLNFIVFFVCGLLFSLVVASVLLILKKEEKRIPLAGILSFFMIAWTIFFDYFYTHNAFTDINFINENLIF